MVGTFPRRRFVGFWHDFHPLLGVPVEHVEGIEPALIRASSSEDDDALVDCVVAHGAIGAIRGYVSRCGYLPPFHGDGIEAPNVVHVVGVWVNSESTCVSAEKDNLVVDDAAAVSPAKGGDRTVAVILPHLLP